MTDQNAAPTVPAQNTDNKKEYSNEEFEAMKKEADEYGLTYHYNIKAKGLAEKLKNFKKDTSSTSPVKNQKAYPLPAPDMSKYRPETKAERNVRLRNEAKKLVRIRLTCMNPDKSAWGGEIFTFSNSIVGEIKKYVPFNAQDDGWHVEQVIYDMLKSRKYVVHFTVKDEQNRIVNRSKLINEFSVEKMLPLTKKELSDLAKVQALGQHIDN